ncbi:fumarylacetoacetase [Ramlibacter alkalitolerans]|uniref:fumarylacetoacetase n=1 Tax=Ramlibacter alkalitolerans TaxID=2039631 RepID=A0ABS1JIK7_9BURK|nr:fumarylacetoacetase [Ramlibacter alkalitolerans]MBL0424063.1 fumarylacetoacetase [Ramlibacter alkalitolerans]
MSIDATHDPALRSWVASANDAATDFPLQNLPFGRFRRCGTGEPWRIGVAIGDQVLDLRAAREHGAWPPALASALDALAAGDLNTVMAAAPGPRRALRAALSQALTTGSSQQQALERCLVPQSGIELTVPCAIGDYTDFYTGIHHATSVGRLFRPDNPLLPNYQWVPIGYHGRSSSIVASGTPIRRPLGQTKAAEAQRPSFGPCQRLDYEVELGFLIGAPNALGEPIAIDAAEDHLFGVTLFNDWSARDIQSWEYQPLGPFLSKNFASTLSPWVVTMEALAPFRAPLQRPAGSEEPLPYLDSRATREQGALAVRLETWLQTAAMRAAGEPAVRISSGRADEAAFWTPAQLVAHHTSGGCNLQAGDLFGSGTLSGPGADQAGSLLELTRGGKEPIRLPNGETRAFLADGDTLMLRGTCEREGFRRIGFGECAGTIVASPAHS